jgi:hypothetical protein
MKFKSSFISTVVLLVTLVACKKNDTGPALYKTADVYVAGFTTTSNNITVATYWKDGVATTLGNTKANSILNSIAIQNTDVYIAGTYTSANGKKVAAYWKNNRITRLTDSTTDCVANSIFVSGTDVYVAGSLNGIAAYWKNGVPTQLLDYAQESVASQIVVQGTNVYLVGNLTNPFGLVFATFWHDDQFHTLPPTDVAGSVATGIALNGNDIYIAGGSYDMFVYGTNNVLSATYWQNDVATTLGDKKLYSNGTGIALNGNDVYVSGITTVSNGRSVAIYWKNGTKNLVSDDSGNSNAFAIALNGSDVYLTGDYLGGYACYWENGVAVKLSNAISSGRSIAVVKL